MRSILGFLCIHNGMAVTCGRSPNRNPNRGNGVGIPTPFAMLKWSGQSNFICDAKMEWEFPLHFSIANEVGIPTPFQHRKWSGNSHSISASQMEWEFPLRFSISNGMVKMEWGSPFHFSISNIVGMPNPIAMPKWSGNPHSICDAGMLWGFQLLLRC